MYIYIYRDGSNCVCFLFIIKSPWGFTPPLLLVGGVFRFVFFFVVLFFLRGLWLVVGLCVVFFFAVIIIFVFFFVFRFCTFTYTFIYIYIKD